MSKTMYDLIFEGLKNKYFQYIPNPKIIVQNVDSLEPKMMGKSEDTFSAWAPLQKYFREITLSEVSLYLEISKEKFDQIISNSKLKDSKEKYTKEGLVNTLKKK